MSFDYIVERLEEKGIFLSTEDYEEMERIYEEEGEDALLEFIWEEYGEEVV